MWIAVTHFNRLFSSLPWVGSLGSIVWVGPASERSQSWSVLIASRPPNSKPYHQRTLLRNLTDLPLVDGQSIGSHPPSPSWPTFAFFSAGALPLERLSFVEFRECWARRCHRGFSLEVGIDYFGQGAQSRVAARTSRYWACQVCCVIHSSWWLPGTECCSWMTSDVSGQTQLSFGGCWYCPGCSHHHPFGKRSVCLSWHLISILAWFCGPCNCAQRWLQARCRSDAWSPRGTSSSSGYSRFLTILDSSNCSRLFEWNHWSGLSLRWWCPEGCWLQIGLSFDC